MATMLSRSIESSITAFESRTKGGATARVHVIGDIHGRVCVGTGTIQSDSMTVVRLDRGMNFLTVRGI